MASVETVKGPVDSSEDGRVADAVGTRRDFEHNEAS